MANECIPFKEPGTRVSGHATVVVTGKRFVAVSANLQPDGTLSVGPAGAGARVHGVSAYDAAQGQKVGIIRGKGTVVPVLAAATLAAGADVASDAQGRVVAAGSGIVAGYLETASTSGQDARVCLI